MLSSDTTVKLILRVRNDTGASPRVKSIRVDLYDDSTVLSTESRRGLQPQLVPAVRISYPGRCDARRAAAPAPRRTHYALRAMRRSVARCCALAGLALLLVAGPAVATAAAQTTVDRVRLPFPAYDGTLTPYTFGTGYPLVTLVYDTLLWRDASGIPRPWLARSVKRSDQGRRVTVTLRDDARWHDGGGRSPPRTWPSRFATRPAATTRGSRPHCATCGASGRRGARR